MTPRDTSNASTAGQVTTASVGTATIEEAIAAMQQGRFVVVMDNEDRENEGDLIMPAQWATEEALAFMIRHTTGIICVPALKERIDALQLPLMVENNTEAHKCKFTVTVDLEEGNTTGVSAADRARTVCALADSKIPAGAFNRPGHIFPLLAQDGGVLVRAGHTEAAVDLARLAGAAPVGYICEINDDMGRMMRRPQLETFAQKFGLPLITISDLIRYRVRHEKLILRCQASTVPRTLQTPLGAFQVYEYQSLVESGQKYDAMAYGAIQGAANVPVFFAGDGIVESVAAQWAQKYMVKESQKGVIIYLSDAKKLEAVSGEVMARQSMFGMGVQILRDLGIHSLQLLEAPTDSSAAFSLEGFGLEVTSRIVLSIPSE